jgi:hypothetical protein
VCRGREPSCHQRFTVSRWSIYAAVYDAAESGSTASLRMLNSAVR